MDFWSRLIAGTSLAPAGNKGTAKDPEKRLARFKREYSQLLQTWRGASNLARDYEAAENIRDSLQDLTAILSDESRRPLPHPCITFASSKQIYVPIGKIATTSYNEGIIREGVALFATLIDSEEEDFVENETFSKSLMNLLVRITGANSIRLGSDTEVEVVELSFNITTKIRLDPEILPAWFTTQDREDSQDGGQDSHEKFTGKTQKEDFPLFYLLIDYIHHEGRIGDFARTGLLYIIEAASSSVALEQWIVESDLATLMATGLGALYSQLSRKLVIDHPLDDLPPILALSDYQQPNTTSEIISSSSPDFQMHMETFLSHLVFWQDVLNHCKSGEVKSTLLEHFQVIFLQQLLYPSLLESSDVDGGSSVAVLTYLRRILEALDHPDMIHLILHYLLALPDIAPAPTGSRASVSAARKRKSMDLATMMMATQVDTTSTPALFNLVDLIQGGLRSPSEQTISVTLQLVSVILRRHHRYAVTTLLWTSQVLSDGPVRPVGAHEMEMDFLLSLAGNVGGEDNFDEVYENHVKDCMSILESHPCSLTLVAPKSAVGTTKFPGSSATIPGAPRDIRPHTLRPEDPMLQTLLSIMATFFINSVETNLSLTGTITDLATCGFMRIDGWLLPDPAKYVYEDEDEDADEPISLGIDDSIEKQEEVQLRKLKKARRTLKWTESQIPAFLTQLKSLVEQVLTYRTEIPRFDDLLQQRREAFQAASSATATPIPIRPAAPPRSSFESTSRSSSPPRPSALDSLAQRIFPELATPSRSNSPRGRRSAERSSSGLSGGYGFATPTTRSAVPPPQFPMNTDSTSRGHSRAFSPSPLRGADPKNGVPASQAAAFAAIDQSILARKVGLPNPKGTVPPIPFPNLKASADEGSKEGSVQGTDDGSVSPTDDRQADREGQKLITVNHVLTNVIVLQEFLLELAALVQVRAGLFGEVRYV
ncbi:hypothetical protein EG329_005111 [Mollisiaceae sp. DMI_Dod_QoI]|nr:hypothetical protein EG329_005111 [Helotiales sp. DMI_Dod_QoI]